MAVFSSLTSLVLSNSKPALAKYTSFFALLEVEQWCAQGSELLGEVPQREFLKTV